MKKLNLSASYLTKFSTNLDGILCTVQTVWPYEPHTPFYIVQYSRERTQLM